MRDAPPPDPADAERRCFYCALGWPRLHADHLFASEPHEPCAASAAHVHLEPRDARPYADRRADTSEER